jgi:hypothetical protein
MKALLLAVVLVSTTAAKANVQQLPIPPIPPAQPPTEAAPVPDLNIVAPPGNERRSMVTLDSGINHRPAPDPGYGFSPGAQYRLDDDRRLFILPGVSVHVPLP